MIYLDYSATTPVDKKVAKKTNEIITKFYGNPSSVHRMGTKSLLIIDKSKSIIADYLKCAEKEIYFTSGATESNNLAIQGVVAYYNLVSKSKKLPHIITTSIEHPSVIEVCKHLENTNQAEVTYINPDTDGIVSPEKIEKNIKQNTILVSVMYVNNEIGTIQPVKQIGKMIAKTNKTRKNKIYYHVDAVQALAYLDCTPLHLKADLLSFSGHKIYGLKGTGILYIRQNTEISPLFFGGSQQKKIRPGTMSVHLIASIAEAVSILAQNREKDYKKIQKLKNIFIDKLFNTIPNIKINGNPEFLSPAIVNIYFPDIDSEAFMTALDLAGICISKGSACTSGAVHSSYVLKNLNYDKDRIENSFRFSIGRFTKKEDIIKAVKIISKIYHNLV